MSDWIANLFPGYKTLAAGLGLIGLGLYQISQKDWPTGLQSVLAGLAALGIRFAK